MFGYITVNRPELKIREWEVYQGYYCGLCLSLKKQYHHFSRLCLNYDMTFLALLLFSLYEPPTTFTDSHCVLHPLKKSRKYHNDCVDYAAKMTIVLTYWKCLDDWQDEKKAARRLYAQALKPAYERIKAEFPAKLQRIEKAMLALRELEQQSTASLDQLLQCFGRVLAEVFVYREDEWEKELYRFGFDLGQFIYLLDAIDDLAEDRQKGRFNPLTALADKEGFEDDILAWLELFIASATTTFECLPLIENLELMRNILYSGVWQKYRMKQGRKEEK